MNVATSKGPVRALDQAGAGARGIVRRTTVGVANGVTDEVTEPAAKGPLGVQQQGAAGHHEDRQAYENRRHDPPVDLARHRRYQRPARASAGPRRSFEKIRAGSRIPIASSRAA